METVDILNNLPDFNARVFGLAAHFAHNPKSDYVKIFNQYIGKENHIDSETVKRAVEKYFQTRDTKYLEEAVVLLAMLDLMHKQTIGIKWVT